MPWNYRLVRIAAQREMKMDYEATIKGIREAGMTQLPALLSECIEASMKACSFRDDYQLVKFVSRRVQEIKSDQGGGTK